MTAAGCLFQPVLVTAKSVRPLISLWVSLATLMLQSMGENSDRRVWFIIDEAPSLQRILELAETLAEARKFGGCFVLGMQKHGPAGSRLRPRAG